MNALAGLLAVVGFFAVGGLLLEGFKPAAHTIIGPEKNNSSSSSYSSTKKGGRKHNSKKHTRKHSH
jgi:hypothetical protein